MDRISLLTLKARVRGPKRTGDGIQVIVGRIGDASVCEGKVTVGPNTTANESQTDLDRERLSTSSKPS